MSISKYLRARRIAKAVQRHVMQANGSISIFVVNDEVADKIRGFLHGLASEQGKRGPPTIDYD